MIELDIKREIGYIILNRPERYNALNLNDYKDLDKTLGALSINPEVKVVIIKGSGKSFCSGSDLNEFTKKNHIELRSDLEVVASVFKGISRCKKLVISAVQGYALGGGCAIVAASDFAIASEDACFILPEVDLNLFPMTIMPLIVRVVGMRKAFEMLFMGKKVNAEEAEKIGLVNFVVKREDLYSRTDELARKFCNMSNLILEMGKEFFQITQSMNYFDAIDVLGNLNTIIWKHDKAQESINKFLKKKEHKEN